MLKAVLAGLAMLSGLMAGIFYSAPDLTPVGYVVVYVLGSICLLCIIGLKLAGCFE